MKTLVFLFSSKNCGYVAAYRYVCKDKAKEDVLHSEGHTLLESIHTPKTKKAMRRFSDSRSEKRKSLSFEGNQGVSSSCSAKRKRLSKQNVAEFLIKNNIKTDDELLLAANKRKAAGEPDLHNFVINSNSKALSELVSLTWRMENAPKVVERQKKERFDVIREMFFEGVCVENCNGEWHRCALQILKNNKMNLYSGAMRQALRKGRQKNNNVLITGPTNCGKSFLLNPLEIVFKAFVNPANGKYAWIGLDECEVAYLNDFRWSPEMITWSDFLLLLEGQTVNLPRPKNLYASDMRIDRSNTIPFFATSKGPIEYVGKFNVRDERETDMMSSRWLTICFEKQIEEPKHVEPCAKCFSKLVMAGVSENGQIY